MEYETILYEIVEPGIAKVTMNRPEKRNAMNWQMKMELDDAFKRAEADPDVRVIITAGAGPHWSSGHDLTWDPEKYEALNTAEKRFLAEDTYYWKTLMYLRNLRKPTIAQVQGACMIGAIQFCSVHDLVIASEDAVFQDQGPRQAIPCLEISCEAWDMTSIRRTKMWMWTGDPMSAQEAYENGYVNKVVPKEKLEEETLKLARKIALMPPVAISWSKEMFNLNLDIMGQTAAWRASFILHQLSHATQEGKELWGKMRETAKTKGVGALMRERDAKFDDMY